MYKRSLLDQVLLCADGSVHLKFLKEVVEDDGTVISSVPHRAIAHSWEDAAKVLAFADERLSLKHAPVENKDAFASVMKRKPKKK